MAELRSNKQQGNANDEHGTTSDMVNTGNNTTITAKRVPRHQRSKSDTKINIVEMLPTEDTVDKSPARVSTEETTALAYCLAVRSCLWYKRKARRSLSMPLESSRNLFFQTSLVVDQEPEEAVPRHGECSRRRGILDEIMVCLSSSLVGDTNDAEPAVVRQPLEQRQQHNQSNAVEPTISGNIATSSPGSFPSESRSSAHVTEEVEEESYLLPLLDWHEDTGESSEIRSGSSLVSGEGINVRNSGSYESRDDAGDATTAAAATTTATTAAVEIAGTNVNEEYNDQTDLAFLGGSLMDEIDGFLMVEETDAAAAQPKWNEARLCTQHAAPTIQTLVDLVEHEAWERVLQLVHDYPDLCKSTVTICFQGEHIPCLILHCIVQQKSVQVEVVDAIVTIHPAALSQGDGKCGRLPLHFAILSGASLPVLRYLCRAMPKTLAMSDDPDAAEGNVALHYAVQYAYDDATIRLILEFSSSWSSSSSSSSSTRTNVCAIRNKRDRLVLHILCSRCCWEEEEGGTQQQQQQPSTIENAITSSTNTNSHQQPFVISIDTVRAIVKEYPKACSVPDRNGRLPLHLCCEQRHPRWDVLQVLVQAYPAGLLVKEHSRKMIPLKLLKQWQSKSACNSGASRHQHQQDDDNDIVALYLQECTVKERRKRQPVSLDNILSLMKKLPLHVKGRRQQPTTSSSTTSITPTIVDLMNCYG